MLSNWYSEADCLVKVDDPYFYISVFDVGPVILDSSWVMLWTRFTALSIFNIFGSPLYLEFSSLSMSVSRLGLLWFSLLVWPCMKSESWLSELKPARSVLDFLNTSLVCSSSFEVPDYGICFELLGVFIVSFYFRFKIFLMCSRLRGELSLLLLSLGSFCYYCYGCNYYYWCNLAAFVCTSTSPFYTVNLCCEVI